jgi:microcystin-dependent protein
MDAFIGEVRPFGFNFTPKGWLPCDGSLLPIPRFPALFAVIGTYYGGDGKVTFALPNLQGNVPMGTGYSRQVPGEAIGTADVTLTDRNFPPHSHILYGRPTENSVPTPSAASQLSGTSLYSNIYAPDPTAAAGLAPQTLGPVGASRPKPNRQPYLPVNFCICNEGEFPPHP